MMKKQIFVLILAFFMLTSYANINALATDFSLDARFSFENDGTFLQITGTTPATYAQHLTVLVYDPAFDDDFNLENLKSIETGELHSNPATLRPLVDFNKTLRVIEISAKRDGSFSVSIPITEGVRDGQYMIIQVAGGGKTPVSGSIIRYYETEASIANITLPAFEDATAAQLDSLFYDKQLLLGISLDESYTNNKNRFNQLFVSVREKDCPNFSTLNDVLKVWDSTLALLSLPTEPSKIDINKFIDNYSNLIDYDFTETNAHYMLLKEDIHKLVSGIFKAKAPTSMSEVNTVFTQATAMALFNSKDTTTVTPVVEKYAMTFGIDIADYRIYCEKFTSYEVNKSFVGKDFTQPEQVAKSLRDRIENLEKKSSGNGGSGGSSGGGGTASSSNERDWIVKDTENVKTDLTEPTPIIPENAKPESVFSDVEKSHWAHDAIVNLAKAEVVNGFEDRSFRPDEKVTREQFVKMLVNAFELSGNIEIDFDDVENNRWSVQYIAIAKLNGIVNGVTENAFMPESIVTRQDAAVMLYRLCNIKGISVSGTASFNDSELISPYAAECVANLAGAGIINGFEDGSFRPMTSLTRAQAMKLIYGLMNQ